jgi:hypothetical protein
MVFRPSPLPGFGLGFRTGGFTGSVLYLGGFSPLGDGVGLGILGFRYDLTFGIIDQLLDSLILVG